MNTPNPKFSLRDNTKKRILKEMIAGLKTKFPSVPNFIMVIDPITSKVISSAIKPVELLEEGILAIERLELGRKPFPQTHAIYFISPTEQSINSIIKDFIEPSDPQYGNIHLFFTNRVPDNLFDKLKRQRTLLERVLTFKEVNIDFQSTENNVFNLNLPETLPVIFSKQDQLEAKVLEEKIVSKLATVIPNLMDFTTFHVLYNKNSQNTISERVAMVLKEKIHKFLEIRKREGLDDEDDDDPVHVKFVILDRTVDPLTPALYDYYYESMLHEFLEPKADLIEYDDKDQDGNPVKKVAILNENDNVWLKYKNEFISEAMLKISQDFDDFYQKNAPSKTHKDDTQSPDLNEMLTRAKEMPMYRELFDKYTLHMSLIERIIKIFNEKELMETGDLEQCLATSIDSQGKTIPNSRLIALIAQKIAQGKLDNNTKTRLMIITSFALELHEKERKSLTQPLPLEGKDLLARLSWLGLKGSEGIVRRKSTRTLTNSNPMMNNSKQKGLPPTLCRHTPLVESILEEVVTNKVDASKMGSIFIPDANKANHGKLNLNKTGWDRDLSRLPKVVFFVIGGITRAEIRTLQDFERRNPRLNVLVGSTNFLTVKDYISGIQQMTPIKTQEISLDMDDSNEAWRDQVSM